MPKHAIEGGGKRYPLNMRTTKAIREKLEAAASESGRSLTQEVEARIERSFGPDDATIDRIADRLKAKLKEDT